MRMKNTPSPGNRPLRPRDAVIVDAVRTPVGRRDGKLAGWRPDDLLAFTLRALVERVGLDAAKIDDVIVGCVDQAGEQSLNIGRRATLIAGFPLEVTGTTIDRQCGSSQQALHFAASSVLAEAADVVIAAGVESMTRVPIAGSAHIYGSPVSPRYEERYEWVEQGTSSEMMAEHFGLSRPELDEFALESHVRAATAITQGRFQREIEPVPVSGENGAETLFDTDEGVRFDTSLEKLAKLRSAFREDGVTTAGNASQISDGAAAVLVMAAETAEELGLKPRARVVAQAISGVDPTMMLHGPISATAKVLRRACLETNDVDLFEVNEAFAVVPVAWLKGTGVDAQRLNVNGGAIALGHPLGASGARIMATLLHELERRGGRYGLQTMCTLGGMATATIIERLSASR